jgi:hypothetical protein
MNKISPPSCVSLMHAYMCGREESPSVPRSSLYLLVIHEYYYTFCLFRSVCMLHGSPSSASALHFLLRFYLRAICPNKCVIKINILLYRPTILDSSVKTQYVHIYVFN